MSRTTLFPLVAARACREEEVLAHSHSMHIATIHGKGRGRVKHALIAESLVILPVNARTPREKGKVCSFRKGKGKAARDTIQGVSHGDATRQDVTPSTLHTSRKKNQRSTPQAPGAIPPGTLAAHPTAAPASEGCCTACHGDPARTHSPQSTREPRYQVRQFLRLLSTDHQSDPQNTHQTAITH